MTEPIDLWELDCLLFINPHEDDLIFLGAGTCSRLRAERPEVPIHSIQVSPGFRGVTDSFLERNRNQARVALARWLTGDDLTAGTTDDDELWELAEDTLKDSLRGYGAVKDEQFASLLKTAIRRTEARQEAAVLGLNPVTEYHFLPLLGLYAAEAKAIRHEKRALLELVRRLTENCGRVVVVAPHCQDRHKTHATVSLLATSLIGAIDADCELRFGATPWFPDLPSPTRLAFLSERDMGAKLDALRVHQSQLERTDYTTIARAMAQMTAATAMERLGGFGVSSVDMNSSPYAEAFETHPLYNFGHETVIDFARRDATARVAFAPKHLPVKRITNARP